MLHGCRFLPLPPIFGVCWAYSYVFLPLFSLFACQPPIPRFIFFGPGDPLHCEENRWGRFAWYEGIVAREYICRMGKTLGWWARWRKGEEVRVLGEIWAATYTTIVTYIYNTHQDNWALPLAFNLTFATSLNK
jgi:hypothetical protein